jgi:hypothetical protein
MSSAKIAISCSGPSSTRPAATNRPANGPFWSSVTTCSTRGPGPSSPPPSRARPPGPASPSGSDRHSAPEAFMGEDRTDPNPLHRAARSPHRARPPGGSRSGYRKVSSKSLAPDQRSQTDPHILRPLTPTFFLPFVFPYVKPIRPHLERAQGLSSQTPVLALRLIHRHLFRPSSPPIHPSTLG